MKVFLHEISLNGTDYDFTQDEAWVREAVARADESTEVLEKIDSEPVRAPSVKQRTVQAHFNLRMVDEVVVITGKLDTYIQLICSRCANFYRLQTKPGFSALYCKDPVMAGVAHLQKTSEDSDEMRPVGQNKGHARHAHETDEEADEGLDSGKDLDITYIAEDFIDLQAVLSEQLQFQIPFQPLCKEDCKGICAQCGADLNIGRCACAKITGSLAFSVLKDIKLS